MDENEEFEFRLRAEQEAAAAAPSPASAITGRGLALGARNIVQGVFNTVAAPADALIGTANYVGGKLDKAFGLAPRPDIPTFGQSADTALNMAGVPQAQTQGEQAASRFTQTGAGLLTGLGAGRVLAEKGASLASREIGQFLAARPWLQAASAATGVTAAEVAQRSGAGPTGQMVAGLAGGLAPGVGMAGAAAGLRGAVRGGASGAEQMRGRIADAERAGTTLTVGQASGSRTIQSAEKGLSHVAGGAAVMDEQAARQVSDIGARMEQVANRNSSTASPTTAGQAVDAGIFGKETGWLDRSRATMGKLYQKLDSVFHPSTRVGVSNTKDMLAKLNEPIAGAENLSANQFTNANIKGIEGAVARDTEGVSSVLQNPELPQDLIKYLLEPKTVVPKFNSISGPVKKGTQVPVKAPAFAHEVEYTPQEVEQLLSQLADGKLPMSAVKKLRTAVGEQLDNKDVSSQVKADKYKPLYEALTADMDAGYGTSPKAQQAWKDANAYTADRHNAVEIINNSVSKKLPEQIFTAITSGDNKGATLLTTVLDRVPKEARQVVADTVLKRLGRTASGESVADAGAFDLQTFQKNWGALSSEAKKTLFGSVSSPMRKFIQSVSKTAETIAKSKEALNPAEQHDFVSSIGRFAASATNVLALPKLAAKGLTSQGVVNSLARPTQLNLSPAAQLAVMQNALQQEWANRQ